MASMDAWNAFSNSGDHENLQRGAEKRLERCHQVAQLGVVRNLVDQAKPNHDICGAGTGESLMASMYFFSDSIVLSDTLNRAKSTLLSAN